MAELHQIVGAILRDVSRARLASDLYTRDISRYYEQDALLRRFPVPRTEIEEIDLDLKFAVRSIDLVRGHGSGAEASTAGVFARYAPRLVAAIVDDFYERASHLDGDLGDAETWQKVKRFFSSGATQITLHQAALRYLERNQGHLIEEGKLDREATTKGLRRVLNAVLAAELERAEIAPDERQATFIVASIDGNATLDKQLGALADAIEAAAGARWGDAAVHVDVTRDALAATPETAVSTLKLKATVRNYVWTEIEGPDGQQWRSLSSQ